MRNQFEVSTATSSIEPKPFPPGFFSWRSVLLGAAVGIAGPAYSGTLLSNIAIWIFLGQGKSIQEAYAYIGQYSFTLPMVIGFLSQTGFSFACGWVAAANGKGASLRQGMTAGLLATSFQIIMLLNPTSSSIPFWFKAIALTMPVLGSIVGASAYARNDEFK